MVDNAGAAGGPGGSQGPGLGGQGGSLEESVATAVLPPLRGHGVCGGKAEDKEWIPVTKLGRLVKDMKIKSLEEIYLFSRPIKDSRSLTFSWVHL
jgi:small subunit ribosomal protein S2e